MKKINVVLKGTGEGILMHSAKGMVQETVTKNPAKKYDSKTDAEMASYRTEKGELMVPARCLKACILNAASWYKFGKKSAKPIIAGCTRIEPREIVLRNNKGKALTEYEIDMRTVVIQQSRIVRSRPLIKEWMLEFDLIYDDSIIGDTNVIQQIIEESGKRIGLLDNRPQTYGENGTFELVKFLPE